MNYCIFYIYAKNIYAKKPQRRKICQQSSTREKNPAQTENIKAFCMSFELMFLCPYNFGKYT